ANQASALPAHPIVRVYWDDLASLGVDSIFQHGAPSTVSAPVVVYPYWLTSRSSRSSKLKSVPKKRVDRSCSAMRRSRSMAGVHIHWSDARSGWFTTSSATPFTSAGAVKRSTTLLSPCEPRRSSVHRLSAILPLLSATWRTPS